MDQKRLGVVSQVAMSDAREPTLPLSVSAGKKAACAMPICALAAATRRSAAAMSGRRSSSSEGRPAGTSGTLAAKAIGLSRRGSEKAAGGLPSSSAIAFSSCARCTPRSTACARVLASCVSACTTSTRAATPAA